MGEYLLIILISCGDLQSSAFYNFVMGIFDWHITKKINQALEIISK
jgi:hypothetical protein